MSACSISRLVVSSNTEFTAGFNGAIFLFKSLWSLWLISFKISLKLEFPPFFFTWRNLLLALISVLAHIKNLYFALPVIILSTITGTANFAQSSFPDSVKPYAPSFIGTLNLVAGLITTVAQFLRVSELLESHRVASLAFGKLSRNIAVELSLPIKERTASGTTFLSACRV